MLRAIVSDTEFGKHVKFIEQQYGLNAVDRRAVVALTATVGVHSQTWQKLASIGSDRLRQLPLNVGVVVCVVVLRCCEL